VRYPLSPDEKLALVALAVGILLMTVTGLGGKPRNSVYLLPLAWFAMASLLAKLSRWAQWGAASVIGLLQLLGTYDVIAHQRTAKGSYNTDYRSVVATLRQWQRQCPAGLITFNHDAVLGELLWESGTPQSSPLFTRKPGVISLAANSCYAVMKTYHEPFDKKTAQAFYQSVQGRGVRIATADISPDADYNAKGWIAGERFSPYYVHLDLYRVERPTRVAAWYGQGWSFHFP
jgi:hypothetical protein